MLGKERADLQALGGGGREIPPKPAAAPTEDFYSYANGEWLRANPIPEGRNFWGPYHVRQLEIESQLQEIVDGWLEGGQLTGDQAKAVDFYRALLDKDGCVENGARTLRPVLKRIRKAGRRQLPEVLGYLSSLGVSHFLDYEYGRHIEGHLISRLDIDDYFWSVESPDPDSRESREYFLGIADDCRAAGLAVDFDLRDAANVIGLDRRLAEICLPGADFAAEEWQNYSWEEFESRFSFDLRAYFRALAPDSLLPAGLTVDGRRFGRLLGLMEATPLRQLKTYLLSCVLERYHAYLSPGQRLGAAKRLGLLNDYFEDVVGREYIERHVPEARLAAVRALVEDVRRVLTERIAAAEKLSPESKERLKHKLDDIVVNVGRGRSWRSYDDVDISADNPVRNLINLSRFFAAGRAAESRDPDFLRCHLSPGHGSQTLRAQASPFYRSICLPAGLLAEPFYDDRAHPAYNLGGIGSTISHEFAHHFQNTAVDHSRPEDFYQSWLTEAERERYEEMMRKLARQLENSQAVSRFEAEPERLVREFAADVLGLQTVLDVAKQDYDPPRRPEAFRQVFLAYARHLAASLSEQGSAIKIGRGYVEESFRVNWALGNCDEFYQAYDCRPGDGMFLAEDRRVSVW